MRVKDYQMKLFTDEKSNVQIWMWIWIYVDR